MQSQQLIADYVNQALANQNMLAAEITFPLDKERLLTSPDYAYYFNRMHSSILLERKIKCDTLVLTRASEALEGLSKHLESEPEAFFKTLELHVSEPIDSQFIDKLIAALRLLEPELSSIKIINKTGKALGQEKLEPLLAFIKGKQLCTEIELPPENSATQKTLDELVSVNQREKRMASFGKEEVIGAAPRPGRPKAQEIITGKRTRKKLKNQNIGVDIEIQQQVEVAVEMPDKDKVPDPEEERESELLTRDEFVRRAKAKEFKIPEANYEMISGHEKRTWDLWLGNISQLEVAPEPVKIAYEYPVSGPYQVTIIYLKEDGTEYNRVHDNNNGFSSYLDYDYYYRSNSSHLYWKSKEITVENGKRKIKLQIQYKDTTVFGQREEFDDIDNWKHPIYYDATKYDEDQAAIDSIKAANPLQCRQTKVTPKLIESPHLNLMTTTACEQLLKYQSKFNYGLDYQHLPAGFEFIEKMVDRELKRFLDYDPKKVLTAKKDFLAIDLSSAPEAQPLSYTLFKLWLDKEPKSNVDKYLVSLYQQLLTKGYQRKQIDQFKKYLPVLVEMTENELISAVSTDFDGLIEAVKKNQQALSKRPPTLHKHLITYYLSDKQDLLAQLKIWDRKLTFNVSDLNALVAVYEAYGDKGLRRLFSLWEETSFPVLQGLHKHLFSSMTTFVPLLDKRGAEAINIINRFDKGELAWWNSLLEQHSAVAGAEDIYTLTKAFQSFLRQIKNKGLVLYPECKFKDIKSLPVTLSRILTIINNTTPADLQEVWASITEINFQSNAAIRAVTDGSANLGAGRAVLPVVQMQPEYYYEGHDDRYAGAPNPKHGFHAIQVRRLDPNRALSFVERTLWKELFKDDANSFQELIALSQDKEELYRNYYRYIADQDYRLPISFYKKAAALIEENFPDTWFPVPYNSFSIRASIFAVVAIATTGFETYSLLRDEKACLKQIKEMCDSFNAVSLPAVIPVPNKVAREVMLREGFLRQMKPIPPLFFLHQIVAILAKGFSISSFDLLNLSALEEKGRKYGGFFDHISRLMKVHKFSLFAGLRFIDDADISEENLFKYVEFANSISDAGGYSYYDSSSGDSATKKIATSLIALMSTFRLTPLSLHAVSLNDFGSIAQRRFKALACALAVLAQMRTNISSRTGSALTEDDFSGFLNEFNNRIAAAPSASEAQLEKIALTLVKDIFGRHFDEGFFEKLEAEELSSDLKDEIRADFVSLEEQLAVEAVLACFPSISDRLNQKAAVQRLARISKKLSPTEQPLFLSTMSKLNKHFDGSLDNLNNLLDAISSRRQINDLLFIMSCSEVKEAKNLIAKLNIYYNSVLTFLETHRHDTLSALDLLPLSASLLLSSEETEANFKLHYEAVVTDLYKLVDAYPNESQVILGLVKNAFTEICLKFGAAERCAQTVAFTKLLHDKLVQHKDPDLVRSLCDHYSETPSTLLEILGGLDDSFSKEEAHTLLFTLSALLNNERDCSLVVVRDFILLCKANKPLIELTKEFFICPPYPDMQQISLWHHQYAASANYMTEMRAAYLAYNTRPCAREPENGFKLDDARRLAPLFQGMSFADDELVAIERETLAVRDIASGSLRAEVLAYKNLSEDQQKQNIARLLACLAELLHRSKGSDGGFGKSFEINTVQYLAVYTFLKSNGHVTSEIATGEGKSRIMMLTNGCAFALGKTNDFVTSDMQLAQRDFLEFQAFFKILGAETSLISSTSPTKTYKIKGVNFSDASNLSLFRNKAKSSGEGDQAIDPDESARALTLDEADRTKFDVSETRYNYSQEANDNIKNMDWIYLMLVRFFNQSNAFERAKIYNLYHNDIDGCTKAFISFLQAQPEYNNDMLARIQALPAAQLESWQEAAFTALDLKLGVDYALEPNLLINTLNGPKMASEARLIYGHRLSRNSKFSFGVHQCLHAYLNDELKNAVSPTALKCAELDALLAAPLGMVHEFHLHPEKQIVYSSTSKSFLHDYDKGELWAVTGTAGSVIEKEEAAILYGKQTDGSDSPMSFVTVPRNKPLKRVDKPLRLVADFEGKIEALIEYIDEARANGRPVLLICEDDKQADLINKALKKAYSQRPLAEQIPADKWQFVDSSTSSEEEERIVANAGSSGCLTISTSRMGRGTDIKLSHVSKLGGGLRVLGAFMPRERDMYQFFGRGGRYGDEGDARLVVDVEELSAQFGKASLDSDFYLSNEFYVKSEQINTDRTKQMERLIRNALSDFRIKITDNFFRYYDSLTGITQKEKREKVVMWSDYTKKVDQLWNQAWPDLLTLLLKPETDMHEIMKRLDQFRFEAQADWQELHGKLKADETVLPLKLDALQLDLRTEHLMRLKMSKRKFTVSDQTQIYDAYDKAFDGRATVYNELFAEWKAIWRGERKLFANTRAWWAGHGILFADTRAWWAGKRPLFATLRAWMSKELTVEPIVAPLQPDLLATLAHHDHEALEKLTSKVDAVRFLESKSTDLAYSLKVELVEAVLDFANKKISNKERVTAQEMDEMREVLVLVKGQADDKRQLINAVADKLQYSTVRFFGPSLKASVAPVLQQRYDEYRKDKVYMHEQEAEKSLKASRLTTVVDADEEPVLTRMVSPGAA